MKRNLPDYYPDQKRFPYEYSCYSFKELLKWAWHNLVLGKKNKENITYPAHHLELNNIEKKYVLTFLGDIIDTFFKPVHFGEDIKEFVSDSDYIIGNFEGTIYHGPKQHIMDQRLDEQILEALTELSPPDKFILSVANNHAGDFPDDIFNRSISLVKDAGYRIFGFRESPIFDINEHLRIYGATYWSNLLRGWDRVAQTFEIDKNAAEVRKPDTFHILYPHWGYELELYPRSEIVQLSRKYLGLFDTVIGDHPHIPQPLEVRKFDINGHKIKSIIEYSLGDVCYRGTSFIDKKYCYGIALKMTVGPIKGDQQSSGNLRAWAIGTVDWTFIHSTFPEPNLVLVDTIDKLPFLK